MIDYEPALHTIPEGYNLDGERIQSNIQNKQSMKATVKAFAPNGNSFTGNDGSEVIAKNITIESNGVESTYQTFAKQVEIGQEIEYTLYDDKKGNKNLKIQRNQPERNVGSVRDESLLNRRTAIITAYNYAGSIQAMQVLEEAQIFAIANKILVYLEAERPQL